MESVKWAIIASDIDKLTHARKYICRSPIGIASFIFRHWRSITKPWQSE